MRLWECDRCKDRSAVGASFSDLKLTSIGDGEEREWDICRGCLRKLLAFMSGIELGGPR